MFGILSVLCSMIIFEIAIIFIISKMSYYQGRLDENAKMREKLDEIRKKYSINHD